MSTSYPFLSIARAARVDYGDVLWFADYLAKGGGKVSDWRHAQACMRLSVATQMLVNKALKNEMERRRCLSRS